jgi:ribonuclease HII
VPSVRATPQHEIEALLATNGYLRLMGVDEAGRGPVAGPVVAAAVYYGTAPFVAGVDDSKKLKPTARAELDRAIRATAEAVGVGVVEAAEIDRLNIREATKLAMRLAIAECLSRATSHPQLIVVDGDFVPMARAGVPEQCFVRGDARSAVIASASIVAKEHRDRLMLELAARYPGWGLEQHKGYLTAAHGEAIQRLGRSPVHRKSFRVDR